VLTKILQALQIDLLTRIEAAGNFSDLIAIDTDDNFDEYGSWPSVLWRLLLCFEDGVKRVSSVHNAMCRGIRQPKNHFLAFIIERNVVRDYGDTAVPLGSLDHISGSLIA